MTPPTSLGHEGYLEDAVTFIVAGAPPSLGDFGDLEYRHHFRWWPDPSLTHFMVLLFFNFPLLTSHVLYGDVVILIISSRLEIEHFTKDNTGMKHTPSSISSNKQTCYPAILL